MAAAKAGVEEKIFVPAAITLLVDSWIASRTFTRRS